MEIEHFCKVQINPDLIIIIIIMNYYSLTFCGSCHTCYLGHVNFSGTVRDANVNWSDGFPPFTRIYGLFGMDVLWSDALPDTNSIYS